MMSSRVSMVTKASCFAFWYKDLSQDVNKVKKNNTYDKETLCPINVPYNQTIIIIDKSDMWDKRKANKIKKFILDIKDKIDIGNRLTIKTIEPNDNNESIAKTYFDLCNPGNKANPLYQNPKRIAKKYHNSFEKPLKEIAQMLLSPSVSKNSPILETLSESIRESKGEKVDIYLVSDVLENDAYDFYKTIPDLNQVFEEYYFPQHKLNKLQIEYINRIKYSERIKQSLSFFKNFATRLKANFQKHKIFNVGYIYSTKTKILKKETNSFSRNIQQTLYYVCYKDKIFIDNQIKYTGCTILTNQCKYSNLNLLIANYMKINAQRNLDKKCIK